MIRRLLYRVSGRLPCRLILIDGAPYLERYYIGKAFGVTAYLHRLVDADGDREVHDHPWRFAIAIGLAGGYVEQRVTHLDVATGWAVTHRRMFPGRVSRLGPTVFHQIIAAKPETWTLFLHGRRIKLWGFLRRLGAEVTYHQPYDVASFSKWYERAPRGADTNREPLRDAA